MEDAEKRKIAKLKLVVETDQKNNNNKDFWTIQSSKGRVGPISYLYLKYLFTLFWLVFVSTGYGRGLDTLSNCISFWTLPFQSRLQAKKHTHICRHIVSDQAWISRMALQGYIESIHSFTRSFVRSIIYLGKAKE